MKRFYKNATIIRHDRGWQVMLDGRALKTQGGRPQIVPTPALAQALADEWSGQGETIDLRGFVLRDMADYAIDIAGPERAATIAALLGFAQTDTLCYRAEPDEPLRAAQNALWDPILTEAEAKWDIHFTRIAGVIHQPQPESTLARLEKVLTAQSDFSLAALTTLASLAASLAIGLAALDSAADPAALWLAANLEEDWQADLWGKDAEAQSLRSRRAATFAAAAQFIALAKSSSES